VGAAGRQRVVDQWSWRHTAERTVEQYRILLDERAGATSTAAADRRTT
jgi:MMP alpha-(1->4)-mannosyltransferase